MALFGAGKSDRTVPLGLGPRGLLPNLYDVVVFILIAGAFVRWPMARARWARRSRSSMSPRSRSIRRNLPEYALRTTLRMFAAIFASLLFTFVVATLAAKSRKAELVIVPALDILQSVPVLGFLTFTVMFFMGFFRGASSARNARRSSRSSPPRPGTWRSASTSRCGPFRAISTR